MSLVLVTGASGFVGSRLLETLKHKNLKVRVVLRKNKSCNRTYEDVYFIDNLDKETIWTLALKAVDTVIHLAARVHVMSEHARDSLSEFRKINVDGTLNLARQAAESGVRRFIFISTIKVNGEYTNPGSPFTESNGTGPISSYAISKWETEQGLFEIADQTGMEVVVIRPPLVYGPGVKANFLKIMEWLYHGIPLPLGAINNKRSLIALDNLVDLILLCMEHPAPANQVFLAADGEDLSTTKLLKKLAYYLGKPARLIPVPKALLEAGLKMAGKADLAIRLCGSLQVDISKARENLGWRPPVTVDEGLRQTAIWFLQAKGH